MPTVAAAMVVAWWLCKRWMKICMALSLTLCNIEWHIQCMLVGRLPALFFSARFQSVWSSIFSVGFIWKRLYCTRQCNSFHLIPLLCPCPNKYVYIMNIHPMKFFFAHVPYDRAVLQKKKKHQISDALSQSAKKNLDKSKNSPSSNVIFINYSLDGLIARFK